MTESYKEYLVDSLRFTRETVAGNWIRGSVFLLLCLCCGFSVSVGVLERGIFLWIFIVFIYSVSVGYCIRIYRGSATPPSFNPAGTLIKDGLIALMALWMWCIPSFICQVLAAISQSLVVWYLSVVLLLLPVMMSPPIFFRYANTGKFLESIQFSTILSAIRTLGWGRYLAAGGIWGVCFFVLTIVMLGLHFIVLLILPARIAPPLSAIEGFFIPVLFVFTARFFTNVLGKHTTGDSIGIVAVN
ncbi:MAG: hypothetical protein STSR0009_19860 [Methanoregula sp.]